MSSIDDDLSVVDQISGGLNDRNYRRHRRGNALAPKRRLAAVATAVVDRVGELRRGHVAHRDAALLRRRRQRQRARRAPLAPHRLVPLAPEGGVRRSRSQPEQVRLQRDAEACEGITQEPPTPV